MTRQWLFADGGMEHGPIRRIRNANAAMGRPYVEGAYGQAAGFGGVAPEKTYIGSGYFGKKEMPAGFTAHLKCPSAHVVTRTKNWVFWCGRTAIASFPTAPASGDVYNLSRSSVYLNSPGQAKYLGLGYEMQSSTTFKWQIHRFTDLGVKDFGYASANVRTIGNTLHWWVIGLNVSANFAYLWVDGVQEVFAMPGAVQTSGHNMKDNRFLAGKGDKSPIIYHDDFAACEGDADTDRPPSSIRQILYQPDADIDTGWAGTYCDVDDENDTTVGDADTDANVITPSGANLQQTFGFPNLVSEPAQTATVEAVQLIWEQVANGSLGAYTGHTPKARLTGGSLYTGSYGSGYDGEPVFLNTWFARLLQLTPEASPVVWTPAKFNALEAGLYSADTKPVGEFYAIVLGEYVARPTANTCGAAARRRWMGAAV